MISAEEADMSREKVRRFWDPGRQLLRTIRRYQRAEGLPTAVRSVVKVWLVVCYRFWSIVTGADIPLCSRIGGGLLMPHPNGIVIHPEVEIGPNCLIFQQVTLGKSNGGVPRIGGHVDIGAGAKVLGNIVVGDHAMIGANAVVVHSVAPGTTVVGVPAREVKPSR